MQRKLICLGVFTLLSYSALANGNDWRQEQQVDRQNEKVIKAAEKEEQQRMEDPSSTAIGGSRSGELEIEKNQDEEMRRQAEKQKFLYEYEDKYRRGL
jgi:sortase (surface protein transpeptidase)